MAAREALRLFARAVGMSGKFRYPHYMLGEAFVRGILSVAFNMVIFSALLVYCRTFYLAGVGSDGSFTLWFLAIAVILLALSGVFAVPFSIPGYLRIAGQGNISPPSTPDRIKLFYRIGKKYTVFMIIALYGVLLLFGALLSVFAIFNENPIRILSNMTPLNTLWSTFFICFTTSVFVVGMMAVAGKNNVSSPEWQVPGAERVAWYLFYCIVIAVVITSGMMFGLHLVLPHA